jgi:hypothetical protein
MQKLKCNLVWLFKLKLRGNSSKRLCQRYKMVLRCWGRFTSAWEQGVALQGRPLCDLSWSSHRGNGADRIVAAHLVCYACLLVIIIAWWLLVCPLTCARIIPPWADKPHAVHAVIQHAMRSISKSAASASTTSIPTAATPSAPTTPPLVLMP